VKPRWALAPVILAGLACPEPGPAGPVSVIEPETRTPLTELGSGGYLGFEGGLYLGGTNEVPSVHDSVGLARGRAIQPLDAGGAATPSGKYVLLSIGMSNTTQEFCSQSAAPPCDSWSFMSLAAADPAVNHTTLVIVNGAAGGQEANRWEASTHSNYDRILAERLAPLGLSELQVQAVWLKVANANPRASLPDQGADAEILAGRMANIAVALRRRYPNIRQVFISSRVYAGYAESPLNPEPYAYESAFGVKAVIATQIRQMAMPGTPASTLGDLNYNTVAPWLAWGPYLWADGTRARSDGLTWERSDFEADGTHPLRPGETKVANMLLAFFKTSPHTRCWFLSSATCP
jgi:hypothetical protein